MAKNLKTVKKKKPNKQNKPKEKKQNKTKTKKKAHDFLESKDH